MKPHAFAAAVASALAISLSTPAGAVPVKPVIGLQIEGGGAQQVYRLANGNYLGLWGFDNREGINPGAGAVTVSSAQGLLDGFGGPSRIKGFYNGATAVNAGASEFDRIVWGFTVADDARLYDSLWIEWTGGNLVFRPPSGGTKTMSATATRAGDPFAVTPVPAPAALPLLLAALGAVGLLARRRKAA